jgi:hypothetical protein
VALFLQTVWGTTVSTLGEARGFINDVDVPHTLISDNAKEEMAGCARDTCTKYRINVKTTVLHSPW